MSSMVPETIKSRENSYDTAVKSAAKTCAKKLVRQSLAQVFVEDGVNGTKH